MYLSALSQGGTRSPEAALEFASSAAEYWRQHAIVKAQYRGDVDRVLVAFKKYVGYAKHMSDCDQKKKLRCLLNFVQLCARVLSEDRATHQPRKIEELDKVCKYIVKIVSPYLRKLDIETTRRQHIEQEQSESWTLVAAASRENVAESAAEYWRQHDALKAKYHDDVDKVHSAFKKYVDHMKDHNETDQKKKLRYLLSYVQLCASVLSEDKTTHQPRKLEELDKVYKYIVKIVNPYLKKLRTETTSQQAMKQEQPMLSNPCTLIAPVANNVEITAEYWRQHAVLKTKYRDNVDRVLVAFKAYMERCGGAADSTDDNMKIRYLLSYLELSMMVLSEGETTHPPRDLNELNEVYKYIVKIVNPYLKKLRSETDKRSYSRASGCALNGISTWLSGSYDDQGAWKPDDDGDDELVEVLALFETL